MLIVWRVSHPSTPSDDIAVSPNNEDHVLNIFFTDVGLPLWG